MKHTIAQDRMYMEKPHALCKRGALLHTHANDWKHVRPKTTNIDAFGTRAASKKVYRRPASAR